ncbi:MAG TPA: hypothetical protein VJM75_05215 [Acidimicrobiales bacterium]|nr:hypothetical protein [Acidimicrobiales bacterium]
MTQTNPPGSQQATAAEAQPPSPGEIAEHVAAMTLDPLVEGDKPLSIWLLVKSRDAEGDIVWGVRNAGEPLGSEELLGALTGFAESLKRDLASDWD